MSQKINASLKGKVMQKSDTVCSIQKNSHKNIPFFLINLQIYGDLHKICFQRILFTFS